MIVRSALRFVVLSAVFTFASSSASAQFWASPSIQLIEGVDVSNGRIVWSYGFKSSGFRPPERVADTLLLFNPSKKTLVGISIMTGGLLWKNRSEAFAPITEELLSGLGGRRDAVAPVEGSSSFLYFGRLLIDSRTGRILREVAKDESLYVSGKFVFRVAENKPVTIVNVDGEFVQVSKKHSKVPIPRDAYGLSRISTDDGSVVWTLESEQPEQDYAFVDERFFLSLGEEVALHSQESGEVIWLNPIGKQQSPLPSCRTFDWALIEYPTWFYANALLRYLQDGRKQAAADNKSVVVSTGDDGYAVLSLTNGEVLLCGSGSDFDFRNIIDVGSRRVFYNGTDIVSLDPPRPQSRAKEKVIWRGKKSDFSPLTLFAIGPKSFAVSFEKVSDERHSKAVSIVAFGIDGKKLWRKSPAPNCYYADIEQNDQSLTYLDVCRMAEGKLQPKSKISLHLASKETSSRDTTAEERDDYLASLHGRFYARNIKNWGWWEKEYSRDQHTKQGFLDVDALSLETGEHSGKFKYFDAGQSGEIFARYVYADSP